VPGGGFAFVKGIFGCGKTLVQAMLAKVLIDLARYVLIVAPSHAALKVISENILTNAPELDALRVVFGGAQKLKRVGERNAQTQDEVPMFRLFQDLSTSRTSRYGVVLEDDLQVHLDKLVEDMTKRGEKLYFTCQPGTALEFVDLNNLDSGDEEDKPQPEE
jgi:hypothetical protein